MRGPRGAQGRAGEETVTAGLTTAKLGWMAAILDFKCMIVRKNNQQRQQGSPQLVLLVESTNVRVIAELSRLTGTKPEPKDQQPMKEWMQRGCREHCPEAHIHYDEGKTMPKSARWSVTGAAAATVLSGLMPYMIGDKPFRELMEEVFEHAKLTGQGSGATLAALRRLAGLGWTIPPDLTAKCEPEVARELAAMTLVASGKKETAYA